MAPRLPPRHGTRRPRRPQLEPARGSLEPVLAHPLGGSDRLLAQAIAQACPSDLTAYFELFLQDGLVFLALEAHGLLQGVPAVLAAEDENVLALWTVVKHETLALDAHLRELEKRYNKAEDPVRRLDFREAVRTMPLKPLDPVDRAARLIFLHAAGTEGAKTVSLPALPQLERAATVLESTALRKGGYATVTWDLTPGSLIYIQPDAATTESMDFWQWVLRWKREGIHTLIRVAPEAGLFGEAVGLAVQSIPTNHQLLLGPLDLLAPIGRFLRGFYENIAGVLIPAANHGSNWSRVGKATPKGEIVKIEGTVISVRSAQIGEVLVNRQGGRVIVEADLGEDHFRLRTERSGTAFPAGGDFELIRPAVEVAAATDELEETAAPPIREDAAKVHRASTEAVPPCWFQTLYGAIKGFHGEITLGPKTLILGPNASDKSAVANALELLADGGIGDHLGRNVVRSGADLADLFAPDEKHPNLRGVLNDGTELTWGLKRTPKGGTAGSDTKNLQIAVPLREVQENLIAGGDKARSFLLRQAGTTVTKETIRAAIDDDLREAFDQEIRWSAGETPVDALLQLQSGLSTAAKEGVKRGETLREKAAEMAAGLAPEPTEETLTDLQDQLEQWAARHAAALQHVPIDRVAIARVRTIESLLPKAAVHRVGLKKQLASLTGDAAKATLRGELSHLLQHSLDAGGICVTCGTRRGKDVLAARLQDVQAKMEKSLKEDGQRIRLQSELDALEKRMEAAQTELRWLRARVGPLDSLQEDSLSEDAWEPSAEALGVELAALRAKQLELLKVQTTWKAVRSLESDASTAERNSRIWRRLVEAVDTAVKTLVEGASRAFEAKVQKYLPTSMCFGLKFAGDKVRFGLVQPHGGIYTALSGAEWAAVTSAIAAACTPPESQLRLLVLPDRAWDPKTLGEVLKALTKWPGQVIVTTTVKPRGRLAGWTVIETKSRSVQTETEMEILPVDVIDQDDARMPISSPFPRHSMQNKDIDMG